MEIETAIRRMLLADSTVNGYVSGKVYKHRLDDAVDGTGGRAVVVARASGWASPDSVKTSEFPIVDLDCWSDHERGSAGEIVRANGEEGAWALWRAVNDLMHAQRDVWWGAGGGDPGVRIVASARYAEPSVLSMKDYEAPFVRGRYALQIG